MIEGLGYGADDYLTKPFSLSVLRSHIQAHLRREQRRSWIRQDGWQIDRQQDVAFRGQPLALTRSEKEILIALRRQPRPDLDQGSAAGADQRLGSRQRTGGDYRAY